MKQRIAFVKFGGLSAGGTERWLQMMAANLSKDNFDIDYYYCDSAPYIGSDYKHANTDVTRLKYLKDYNVNLIKFNVGYKDLTTKTHEWVKTDFWDIFDESKYDFVQTAKAGAKEYPYYLINLPVVEFIALSGEIDFSPNIIHSIHLSNWQREKWLKLGGKLENSSVIPIPVDEVFSLDNLREELKIPSDAIVAGFHQRPDNNTASDIPLKAFAAIQEENRHFIIMGGGPIYKEWAKELNIKNIHFIESNSESLKISSFLNTLDIFAHGRKDGETFGTVFAEAMMHGLPCLSHKTGIADAQGETMSGGGFFVDDLPGYIDKLKSLFENKDLREKMGRIGKEYAQEYYTISATVKNLSLIYNQLAEKISKIDKSGYLEKSSQIKKASHVSFKNRIKIIFYNKYFFKVYRVIKKIMK
jgi:glycosyltransferase involved in cell wall biosynthesis